MIVKYSVLVRNALVASLFAAAAQTPAEEVGAAPPTMSLAGDWEFALDENDEHPESGTASIRFTDSIRLPGSTAQQRKGPVEDFEPRLDRETMERLRERHPYVGPAWYQREVSIPADWGGQTIRLTLERVLWESKVWVDGQPVGSAKRSLSAPHHHDLTAVVRPGETHTLTIRIDNREIVPIGRIGHAYTPGTQTLWNGVIGDLSLEALPPERIDHARFVAQPDGLVEVEVSGHFGAGQSLRLLIEDPIETSATEIAAMAVDAAAERQVLEGRLDGVSPWSEFSPQLYRATVELRSADGSVEHAIARRIGFREFRAEGRRLLVNGVETFLRGNLECAIFPATGHPDAEGPQWDKIMQTSREYGLNHLRFHSWCPPEAAFEAADRHGVYLQAELPNWTFDMGRKPPVDDFLLEEGRRILREYAHHPSFVMLSLGNELTGDLAAMDRLVETLRAEEPRLLYTSTSYAFSPRGESEGPADDFFISQRTATGWVRGQGFLNSTFPSTDTDYAEGSSSIKVPLITHEVGQYVVYPDLSTLPKYESTPVRATAMEAIRDDLRAKGMLAEAPRFTRDSGKLASLLYKEDIERALRTKGLSGIQLLQLQDFPGQSTATVGLLDAFWDSKGLIDPSVFRQACSGMVPLVRLSRFVWQGGETLTAELELANFTGVPIECGFEAQLIDQAGDVIASHQFSNREYPVGNGLPVGNFEASLSDVDQARRLELVVRSTDGGAENAWPIWVYPREQEAPDALIHSAVDADCLADLAAGRSVLLLADRAVLRRPIKARFIPVFWSPLHFPNQPGTLGATIDAEHPLWSWFPTETHTNWQWWELFADSVAVDLTGHDPAIAAPLRFVDKFDRNALPTAVFEARVGPGRLLACTLDVTTNPDERIVARQLLRALKNRVASSDFEPSGSLSVEELTQLFRPVSTTATGSSSHREYPAANAIDGDPATIWHSDWTDAGAKGPFALTIDLREATPLDGLRLQNRLDGRNGRVKTARVETSTDGVEWASHPATIGLPNSPKEVTYTFSSPAIARYVRLTVESSHGGDDLASLAEVECLTAAPDDVRELGLIEGFND